MFQSLGGVLMALVLPKAYKIVWKMRQEPSNAILISKRLTGWTPIELGTFAARRWNLPPMLRLSIAPPKGGLTKLRPERRQAVNTSIGLHTLLFYAGLPKNTRKHQEKMRKKLMESLQINNRQLSLSVNRGLFHFFIRSYIFRISFPIY